MRHRNKKLFHGEILLQNNICNCLFAFVSAIVKLKLWKYSFSKIDNELLVEVMSKYPEIYDPQTNGNNKTKGQEIKQN